MQALILVLCGILAFAIASPFIALWRRGHSPMTQDLRQLRAAARKRDMARKVQAARRQRLVS